MDERGEALRGLVIAGGEAAKLLQSAEEDLDEVALLEQVPVVLGLDSPRGMRPNHRPDAAPSSTSRMRFESYAVSPRKISP